MGMAASQARFLSLTARQTNLQFEGQQINQQRTTLSNQSANCYNSLLAMTVPVPPSTDDYTKLVYTFTPTVSTTATIDQIFANPGNNTYKITYTEYGSKEGIIESMNRARTTSPANAYADNSNYDNVGSQYYRKITTQDEFNKYASSGMVYNDDKTPASDFEDGHTYWVKVFGKANGQDLTEVTGEAEQNFVNSELERDDYYQYELNGVKYYIKQADVSRFAEGLPLSVYTTGSVTVKDQGYDLEALVDYDNQARVSAITIHRNGVVEKYSVTTKTEVDEEAYNDAYNQYIYEQYLYDQKQTEINASIEIIQSEDKNLELRLKQLDTENNAIQNEIEAVSKVLKNNIEGSFKTFNA